MLKAVGVMLAFFFASLVLAEALLKPKNSYEDGYAPKVKYISNPDGDTIIVDISDIPAVFGKHLPIRIAHIDTPEIHSNSTCEKALAEKAKDLVTKMILASKTIQLESLRRDRYFRVVAEVKLAGGVNLGSVLLEEKLAIPYEGDKKPATDWCKFK